VATLGPEPAAPTDHDLGLKYEYSSRTFPPVGNVELPVLAPGHHPKTADSDRGES
jgi:hypothetical protein